jgi:hypothetical protein
MVHKIGVPANGEHTYAAYNEVNYRELNSVRPESYIEDWCFFNEQKNQINGDFWTLPDF